MIDNRFKDTSLVWETLYVEQERNRRLALLGDRVLEFVMPAGWYPRGERVQLGLSSSADDLDSRSLYIFSWRYSPSQLLKDGRALGSYGNTSARFNSNSFWLFTVRAA